VILVDTSIWIDHLRATNGALVSLLQSDAVCIHPWIIGELACGNMVNRTEILELLGALPQLQPASDGEVLHFIERRHLMGRGVGYIDMHLLAASVIHTSNIWTRDKRLGDIATDLGLAYQPNAH